MLRESYKILKIYGKKTELLIVEGSGICPYHWTLKG
jgi:hypothetical protein